MLVRKVVTLLALLVCLAVGAATPAAAPDTTVAVLYFDYDGANEEMGFLRKGLAQMLVTDLTGTPGIQVVERARLEAVLAELDLGASRKIDSKTAAKIGKLLGARQLVVGGYFDLRGTLRIDARVIDVETGKVLRSVGANNKVDDFLALEAKLANELKAFLSTQTVNTTPVKPATVKPATVKPATVKTAAAPKRAPKSKRPSTKTDKRTSPVLTGGAVSAKPVKVATVGEADQAEVAAVGGVATEPTELPKVHASAVARYGLALDNADRGKEERAREILLALVKEVPKFKAPAVDLKRFLK